VSTGALELRDLVKHYRAAGDAVRAVDGVSLTVAPGEIVALYGPSGSGKSTLLMLAAALLAPDRGQVLFDGRDIGTLTGREAAAYRSREVGLITQELHLMPGASALDNALMKLPLLGLTLRQSRARAQPWLVRVGLGDRADRLPEQLSMGERQRITIARALAAQPRLLLADEPTGSLDSARTEEVLLLLREIAREHRIPALLVTHDHEAMEIVDRALTLRDGRIVAEEDLVAVPPDGRQLPRDAAGRSLEAGPQRPPDAGSHRSPEGVTP
jgi:putative ABC transport system ATP-binding protein